MAAAEILGIGVDIEDVGRFTLDRVTDSHFLQKLFSESELDYCFSMQFAAPHLAVRYAGKEAVIKAISNIGKGALGYRDIEIRNDSNGVPHATVIKPGCEDVIIGLSLSHCSDKAVAFCVVTSAGSGPPMRIS